MEKQFSQMGHKKENIFLSMMGLGPSGSFRAFMAKKWQQRRPLGSFMVNASPPCVYEKQEIL